MSPASYALCYLAVVGAGVSVALQQVLNANLRTQLDSPWWAGFVSYFVGTVVMLSLALTSSAPRWSGALGKTSHSWVPWGEVDNELSIILTDLRDASWKIGGIIQLDIGADGRLKRISGCGSAGRMTQGAGTCKI